MKTEDLLIKFYKFETDHNLFERTDKYGVHYWDIFRYEIFFDMTFSDGGNMPKPRKLSIKQICIYIWNSIIVLCSLKCKYKYLGYLASRNRYGNTGLMFDQNSFDIISQLPDGDTILMETIGKMQPCAYGMKKRVPYPSLLKKIFRSNLKLAEADQLVQEVRNAFPQNRVSVCRINQLYSDFYAEKKLCRFLYMRWGVKKIFMTQNGILKGSFAAAKSLGIPVYEFQHGIVNNGHMAYSYPAIDNIGDKIYRASHFLTFSDFWLKDCFIPYTKVITLGNDYFVPKIDETQKPSYNKVLIASSAWMAEELRTFLYNALKRCCNLRNYTFVYKLHPNEYDCVADYRTFFKEFDNVIIATNEKNVAQWMTECSSMLTIYSTAAYEALQCNRKVIILKRLSYEQMNLISGCNNMYFVDNEQEFSHALKLPIENSQVKFFSPFDQEIAKKIINE